MMPAFVLTCPKDKGRKDSVPALACAHLVDVINPHKRGRENVSHGLQNPAFEDGRLFQSITFHFFGFSNAMTTGDPCPLTTSKANSLGCDERGLAKPPSQLMPAFCFSPHPI